MEQLVVDSYDVLYMGRNICEDVDMVYCLSERARNVVNCGYLFAVTYKDSEVLHGLLLWKKPKVWRFTIEELHNILLPGTLI